jgi:4-amino-4-deoxy-L-arabinose transferase-like glycosyltransferase
VSGNRRWIWVWIFSLLPLLGWWTYGLLDLDEGFYGAVTTEMNRRGEWITPFYNGSPWFEKPILLYWLAKPSILLFGEMIGPRLPSILSTVATYGLVAWFVRRRLGDSVAQSTLLILSSSLLVVGAGRMMLTDPPLVLCLTGAMIFFWESLEDSPRWRLVSAIFIGFGILAKGPVAAILFILAAGWTYWREPELRTAFRNQWLAGFAILVLINTAWYLPAYLVNGQLFVNKFLIEQNIGRFTGGDAAHTLGLASLPLYIPILFLGMIPWSIWIWPAWPKRVSRGGENNDTLRLRRYLATYAATVFLFFTLSGAKLPHYILPVFPPLAILLAIYLHEKKWMPGLGFSMCVFMCILANGVFSWWYRQSGQLEAHTLIRYVKKQSGKVALYQLGRRQKSLGTGQLKLQETSLPSLLMYLDANAIDTDDLATLIRTTGPVWIFTRAGRIETEDFVRVRRAGRILEQIKPNFREENFSLYRMR